MKHLLGKYIRNLLRSFNYELIRYPYGDNRVRMDLIKQHGITIIFDIGANTGEYARQMREIGYRNKIVSFEPRKDAFNELYKNAKKDSSWQVINIGLGNQNSIKTINIAGNETSSSILEMNKIHVDIKPHSKYKGKEEIQVKKFDSILDDYANKTDIILMKIDTQGYEKYILEGAEKSLHRIKGVQLELSLVELYKDSSLYTEMIPFLENLGFSLCALERGFFDKNTGQLLQVDGIFYRK